MFKIRRSSTGRWVLYFVSGRIDEEAVSELQSLLGRESAGSRLRLDLGEVQLVDAEAVEFFARCEDAGIKLRNCPAYVREWIASNRRQG
jgi:anti-anti-sigma regulatory factor